MNSKENILQHYKNPKNWGIPSNLDEYKQNQIINYACGDELTVYIKLNKDLSIVEDIRFIGSGCSLCIASASILSEKLIGKGMQKVQDILQIDPQKLLEFQVGEGRIKCISLSFEVTKNCLETIL